MAPPGVGNVTGNGEYGARNNLRTAMEAMEVGRRKWTRRMGTSSKNMARRRMWGD